MSEGINFSDALGRCVVVVGVPFPNPQDPVLRERLSRATTTPPLGGPGRLRTYSQLYETMAMNAVNQSVGRAIRHARDYGTIVLVDSRYSLGRLTELLPAWIASYGVSTGGFADVLSGLTSFFAHTR